MITVGAFEAKTHLSQLLEQVVSGEEVLITRRGKPVARLVPEVDSRKAEIDEVIKQLKMAREGCRLDGLSWRELRDEGRR